MDEITTEKYQILCEHIRRVVSGCPDVADELIVFFHQVLMHVWELTNREKHVL